MRADDRVFLFAGVGTLVLAVGVAFVLGGDPEAEPMAPDPTLVAGPRAATDEPRAILDVSAHALAAAGVTLTRWAELPTAGDLGALDRYVESRRADAEPGALHVTLRAGGETRFAIFHPLLARARDLRAVELEVRVESADGARRFVPDAVDAPGAEVVHAQWAVHLSPDRVELVNLPLDPPARCVELADRAAPGEGPHHDRLASCLEDVFYEGANDFDLFVDDDVPMREVARAVGAAARAQAAAGGAGSRLRLRLGSARSLLAYRSRMRELLGP